MRRVWVLVVALASLVGVMVVPAAGVAPSSTGDAPVAGTVVRTPAGADGPAVTRYFGATRADTAALLARDGFGDADTILLARQDNFPDSLGGGFLAGQLGAPVVLTDTNTLSPEAQAVIDDLEPSKVVILGGTSAVSTAVENALTAQGLEVSRLAGPGRYDTGAEVATAEGTVVGTLDGAPTAIVASGTNFPDALVMSALAYAKGWPLLLTDPTTLVPQTADVLGELGITRVLLTGGPGAVSPAVQTQLEALGITVTRLAGDDRVATAIAIAEFAVQQGLDPSVVHLATGRAFPDALALGPLAALVPSPVLLANTRDDLGGDSIRDWLGDLTCVTGVVVAGGPGALADTVVADARARVEDADDCTTPTPTPNPTTPTPPPPTACTDDQFEPNDTRGTAATITSGQVVSARTCPEDESPAGFIEDNYTVEAYPGDTVTAELTFDDDVSELQVQLVDVNGNGVASTATATGQTATIALGLNSVMPLFATVFDVDGNGVDYTLEVTVTPPSCPADDLFEDNDDLAGSTPLTTTLVRRPGGLTIRGVTCPGDEGPDSQIEDLFAVEVNPGDTLSATVDHDSATSEIDLYVYSDDETDTNGNGLGFDDGFGDTAALEIEAVPGQQGPFHVDVYDFDENGVAYLLTVEVRSPNCADADPFEEGDNDANIRNVPPFPVEAFGVPFHDVLCVGDSDPNPPTDTHVIPTTPGQHVTGSLVDDGLGAPFNYDLYLIDADGDNNVFRVGEAGPGRPVTVVDGLVGADRANVTVQNLEASPVDSGYQLTLDARDPTCDDGPDVFEPNDSVGTAATLPSGGVLVGTICDDNDDWFAVPAPAGSEIRAFLEFVDAEGDLDLYLRDTDGNVIAEAISTSDDEEIVVGAPGGEDGQFRLQVNQFGPVLPQTYRLTVEVTLPSCPADDGFEDNDQFLTAVEIGFETAVGALCGSDDDDWFELPTIGFSTVSFEITGVGTDVFQFQIWDDNGLQIATTSAGTTPSISRQADGDQPYRLRVLGSGPDLTYEFTVDTDTRRAGAGRVR